MLKNNLTMLTCPELVLWNSLTRHQRTSHNKSFTQASAISLNLTLTDINLLAYNQSTRPPSTQAYATQNTYTEKEHCSVFHDLLRIVFLLQRARPFQTSSRFSRDKVINHCKRTQKTFWYSVFLHTSFPKAPGTLVAVENIKGALQKSTPLVRSVASPQKLPSLCIEISCKRQSYQRQKERHS